MTHAIITGGSSGIGFEIARIFIARGYSVSLMARRIELLEAARDGLGAADRIRLVSVDVADEAALKGAVEEAEAALGPCDILVSAAGRVDPAFFEAQESDLFAAQIGVNLMGSVHAVRAVHAGMARRGKGRIMLISSGAADRKSVV